MGVLDRQVQMMRDIIADQKRWGKTGTATISNWNPVFDNNCSAADLIELEKLGYVDIRGYGPGSYNHVDYSLTGKAILEFGK